MQQQSGRQVGVKEVEGEGTVAYLQAESSNNAMQGEEEEMAKQYGRWGYKNCIQPIIFLIFQKVV